MPDKSDPSTIPGLRRERRALKQMADRLEEGVPVSNYVHSERREMINTLLVMASHPSRVKFRPDLAKVALEVYSYNDRFAVRLLREMVEVDWKEGLRELKAGQQFKADLEKMEKRTRRYD